MAVALLAQVRPLYQLPSALCEMDETHPASELLWHTEGKPWTAEQLTPFLPSSSHTHLGVALGGREWRQIQVALIQKFARGHQVHGLEPVAGEASAHNISLQTGHSPETEAHHYVISIDTLHGFTDPVAQMWLATSLQWHRDLGIAPISLAPATRKRPFQATLPPAHPPATTPARSPPSLARSDKASPISSRP